MALFVAVVWVFLKWMILFGTVTTVNRLLNNTDPVSTIISFLIGLLFVAEVERTLEELKR